MLNPVFRENVQFTVSGHYFLSFMWGDSYLEIIVSLASPSLLYFL